MTTSSTPYVELHCHSAFSFLDGTSTPLELAATAAELGYPALALTDHDGLWGSMEFAQSCKDFGIRPITGTELTVALPGGGSDAPAAGGADFGGPPPSNAGGAGGGGTKIGDRTRGPEPINPVPETRARSHAPPTRPNRTREPG